MKRYLIPTIVILSALAVAWSVFGQDRGSGQGLSEEQRAQMRERMQNMSEEERQQFRAQMRERMGSRGMRMSSEEQLKAIDVIEKQLAKLKASIEQPAFDRSRYQEMSEEERSKLREQMRAARQERQKTLQTIITQIVMLQGRGQSTAEGQEFIIVNSAQLKAIQELAVKEKATETAERLTALMQASPRGGMGRQQGRPGQRGQRGAGAGQRQRDANATE